MFVFCNDALSVFRNNVPVFTNGVRPTFLLSIIRKQILTRNNHIFLKKDICNINSLIQFEMCINEHEWKTETSKSVQMSTMI